MSTKKYRKQMRDAQARYRQVHAKKLGRIQVAVNVLQRRQDRVGLRDIERLAAALRRLLSADATVALRAALSRRR